MNFSLSKGFVASLLLALSSPSTTTATEYIVTPDESIAAKIHNAGRAMPDSNTGLAFDSKPRFSLYAKRADSDKTVYMARVREAVPAVTSKTTISIQDGESSYVNEDDLSTILVSDDEDGVLVFIAVEKEGGNVNGIVHKGNGEKMKFTQRGGGGKVGLNRHRRVSVFLSLRTLLNRSKSVFIYMSSNRQWPPSPKPLSRPPGRAAPPLIWTTVPFLSMATMTTAIISIMIIVIMIMIMTSNRPTPEMRCLISSIPSVAQSYILGSVVGCRGGATPIGSTSILR